jgi:hypothetical protein
MGAIGGVQRGEKAKKEASGKAGKRSKKVGTGSS